MISLETVDNIRGCPEINYHLKILVAMSTITSRWASECKQRQFCLILVCTVVKKLATNKFTKEVASRTLGLGLGLKVVRHSLLSADRYQGPKFTHTHEIAALEWCSSVIVIG